MVGSDRSKTGSVEALAYRWKKGTWTFQNTEFPAGGTSGQLEGISCTAIEECNAVGSYGKEGKVYRSGSSFRSLVTAALADDISVHGRLALLYSSQYGRCHTVAHGRPATRRPRLGGQHRPGRPIRSVVVVMLVADLWLHDAPRSRLLLRSCVWCRAAWLARRRRARRPSAGGSDSGAWRESSGKDDQARAWPITLSENKPRLLQGLRGAATPRGWTTGQAVLTRHLSWRWLCLSHSNYTSTFALRYGRPWTSFLASSPPATISMSCARAFGRGSHLSSPDPVKSPPAVSLGALHPEPVATTAGAELVYT